MTRLAAAALLCVSIASASAQTVPQTEVLNRTGLAMPRHPNLVIGTVRSTWHPDSATFDERVQHCHALCGVVDMQTNVWVWFLDGKGQMFVGVPAMKTDAVIAGQADQYLAPTVHRSLWSDQTSVRVK